MTVYELKAWIDGFCEGKDGLTAAELTLLRDKVSKVTEPLKGMQFQQAQRAMCGDAFKGAVLG